MKNKPWFDVKTQADGASAEVHIFGFIGDWIDDLWGGFDGVTTAKGFVDELAKLPESVKTLRVRINSPGGDAFGGVAIANTLRAEQAKGRRVETIIEGLAASAASIVAMGGIVVKIADNGLLMVHAPWTIAVGNANELRAQADILDTIRDTLVKTYQWHSMLDELEILALIDGEDGQGTWLDADAAIAAGLATEKIEGLKAAASIDPRAVAKLKVPEKYAARVKELTAPETSPPPAPAPEPAVEALEAAEVFRRCKAAGLDLDFGMALIEGGAPLTAAELAPRISGEVKRRADATARELEIRALCATAKQADLADGYVSSGMAAAQVKDHLTKITAKLEAGEIDAGLRPDQGTEKKTVIDHSKVFAERNKVGQTAH